MLFSKSDISSGTLTGEMSLGRDDGLDARREYGLFCWPL